MDDGLDLDYSDGEEFSWQEFIEAHRWSIFIGLVGLALISLGVKNFTQPKEKNRIQIVSSEISPTIAPKVTVDIAGSVNNPGIYSLPSGSRIQDVITMAGGLSGDADQTWIEQHLNRASRVSDGQKIYIYGENEIKSTDSDQQQGTIPKVKGTSTVPINSANQATLESLWGVGPVTAKAIISGRPYSSVQELLDRKIIKPNVWERNKDLLSL